MCLEYICRIQIPTVTYKLRQDFALRIRNNRRALIIARAKRMTRDGNPCSNMHTYTYLLNTLHIAGGTLMNCGYKVQQRGEPTAGELGQLLLKPVPDCWTSIRRMNGQVRVLPFSLKPHQSAYRFFGIHLGIPFDAEQVAVLGTLSSPTWYLRYTLGTCPHLGLLVKYSLINPRDLT